MMNAILFPGQGSHYVGMGRVSADNDPLARALWQQADDLLDFSLSRLCFHGPETSLTATENQQPAIFVASLAAWQLCDSCREEPVVLAGHSLGQLSALTAAGALCFADGLHLAHQRGLLMARSGEAQPGGMSAVLRLDAPVARDVCARASADIGEPVVVANENCPGQLVFSGSLAALERAEVLARQAGARRITRLPISIASHSPLMAQAQRSFVAILDTIPVQAPRWPVYGTLSAELLTTPAAVRHELAHQLTQPVRWEAAITTLIGAGFTRFTEVGPGDVLTRLLKHIDPAVTRLALDSMPDLRAAHA